MLPRKAVTNPYAPPQSAVRDKSASPQERPRQVRWAVLMLWTSLVLGLVNVGVLKATARPGSEAGPMTWVIPVVVFAVMAILTVSISAGRNWARIVFAVLFVLGALPLPFMFSALFGRSVAFGSISVAQAVLQLVALLLIFSKAGRPWFRRL